MAALPHENQYLEEFFYLPEPRLPACAPVETLLVFQRSAASHVTVAVTFLEPLEATVLGYNVEDGPRVPWNEEAE